MTDRPPDGLVLKRTPTADSYRRLAAAAANVLASAEAGDDPDLFSAYYDDHRDRLALDLTWALDNFSKDAAVCEVGGYPFFMTKALMDHDIVIDTIHHPGDDVADMAARCGIKPLRCDIETQAIPVAAEKYDEVLLNEVFEHLRINPILTLREILRVLRPGGRLWLSTPNLRSAKGIYNFLFRAQAWSCIGSGLYSQYKPLLDGESAGHVREYTAAEVSQFLRDLGLRRNTVMHRGRYRNPAANAVCAALPSLRPYFSVVAIKAERASG